MKKIYVWLFVTAGTILSAKAQPFEKGDKLLGGSIGLFHQTRSVGPDNQASNLNVSPSFGVFTKTNRLTGISLQFNSNLNAQHTVGLGLYKQYWNSLGKNIYFIMQGQVAAGYGSEKLGDRNDLSFGARHNQYYTLSANVSPGFAYRLNRRLIVDAFLENFIFLGYAYTTSTNTFSNGNQTKFNTNVINLSSSLNGLSISNIGIGFRYIL